MASVTTKGLPKRIRVAAFDIELVTRSMAWSYQSNRWGEFDTAAQQINLQPEFPTGAKMVDTVLHEIGHAIYWAFGLADADQEERIVMTMATAWTQIWRDNPKLLAWMTRTLA